MGTTIAINLLNLPTNHYDSSTEWLRVLAKMTCICRFTWHYLFIVLNPYMHLSLHLSAKMQMSNSFYEPFFVFAFNQPVTLKKKIIEFPDLFVVPEHLVWSRASGIKTYKIHLFYKEVKIRKQDEFFSFKITIQLLANEWGLLCQ